MIVKPELVKKLLKIMIEQVEKDRTGVYSAENIDLHKTAVRCICEPESRGRVTALCSMVLACLLLIIKETSTWPEGEGIEK